MKDEKKPEIEGYEFVGTTSSNNPELDGIDMYREIDETFECFCGEDMDMEEEMNYGCCQNCADSMGLTPDYEIDTRSNYDL